MCKIDVQEVRCCWKFGIGSLVSLFDRANGIMGMK